MTSSIFDHFFHVNAVTQIVYVIFQVQIHIPAGFIQNVGEVKKAELEAV